MILTGSQIASEVVRKRIVIDPFDVVALNPNSYNYRLGDEIKSAPFGVLDANRVAKWGSFSLVSGGSLLLMPGVLYLASTLERIGSKHYVTSLIGKSSIGRLGLYLQVSADLGHQGAVHRWTLELCVVQPVRIYSRMVIGQVSFWKPYGKTMPYRGVYSSANCPLEHHGELFE